MSHKDFANPLAVFEGTFVSTGRISDAYVDGRAFRVLNDVTCPEILEEEERVRVGKRHHGLCAPERYFTPRPLRFRDSKGKGRKKHVTFVMKFPRRGKCFNLPAVTPLRESDMLEPDETGPARLTDDGMSPSERIAALLELCPGKAFEIFQRATNERRETILYAMVSAVHLLTEETRRRVAREVKHFPTHPFTPKLQEALAS